MRRCSYRTKNPYYYCCRRGSGETCSGDPEALEHYRVRGRQVPHARCPCGLCLRFVCCVRSYQLARDVPHQLLFARDVPHPNKCNECTMLACGHTSAKRRAESMYYTPTRARVIYYCCRALYSYMNSYRTRCCCCINHTHTAGSTTVVVVYTYLLNEKFLLDEKIFGTREPMKFFRDTWIFIPGVYINRMSFFRPSGNPRHRHPHTELFHRRYSTVLHRTPCYS